MKIGIITSIGRERNKTQNSYPYLGFPWMGSTIKYGTSLIYLFVLVTATYVTINRYTCVG
jgi:hypothetical protein